MGPKNRNKRQYQNEPKRVTCFIVEGWLTVPGSTKKSYPSYVMGNLRGFSTVNFIIVQIHLIFYLIL